MTMQDELMKIVDDAVALTRVQCNIDAELRRRQLEESADALFRKALAAHLSPEVVDRVMADLDASRVDAAILRAFESGDALGAAQEARS